MNPYHRTLLLVTVWVGVSLSLFPTALLIGKWPEFFGPLQVLEDLESASFKGRRFVRVAAEMDDGFRDSELLQRRDLAIVLANVGLETHRFERLVAVPAIAPRDVHLADLDLEAVPAPLLEGGVKEHAPPMTLDGLQRRILLLAAIAVKGVEGIPED